MVGHSHALAILAFVVLFGLPAEAQTVSAETTEGAAVRAKGQSTDDGWPDLSNFLDGKYGFLPLLNPITEPALGYGAAGGLAFIDKTQGGTTGEPARPNITIAGGLGTDNGTWGAGGGDMRHWFNGRLQTLVGIVGASMDLDFYGMGENGLSSSSPLEYTLEPLGGGLQGRYRLGLSRVWAGLSYAFASTQVSFDAPAETPGLPDYESESNVGCLTPSLTYDSRDNIFTPTTGTYVEVSAGLFSTALGGDDDFQRVQVIAMQYVRLDPRVYLGLRGDWAASFGDPPFYLEPYIGLRGAPLLRYLGTEITQIEAELRWQFWNRISLVGFGGRGYAMNDFADLHVTNTIETGGVGFRYNLARKDGIHAGMDVAFGPDVTAVYFQTGSAWVRP